MGWDRADVRFITSDFWVAEAYPFLSAMLIPHFPLGIGTWLLYVFTFNQIREQEKSVRFVKILLAGISSWVWSCRSGVVLALLVLLAVAAWELYPRLINSKTRQIYGVHFGFVGWGTSFIL